MLRELSQTLLDLQTGFEQMAAQSSSRGVSVRLTGMELALPMELRMVFADGGCRLLADVPRSRSEGALATPASRLMVAWEQRPVNDVLGDGR